MKVNKIPPFHIKTEYICQDYKGGEQAMKLYDVIENLLFLLNIEYAATNGLTRDQNRMLINSRPEQKSFRPAQNIKQAHWYTNEQIITRIKNKKGELTRDQSKNLLGRL